ncbi:hypothetical protein OAL67_00920 [bacterium]|nr:hypothetical protein [bacterium]
MKKLFYIPILLIIVCVAGYLIYTANTPRENYKEGFKNVADEGTSSEEDVNIEAQIKAQLIEKHGGSDEIAVSVEEITKDIFARGYVGPADGGPGGGWYAKKVGAAWELVWDGNGLIFCTSLDGYEDFPNTMIPECYDDTKMESVAR